MSGEHVEVESSCKAQNCVRLYFFSLLLVKKTNTGYGCVHKVWREQSVKDKLL